MHLFVENTHQNDYDDIFCVFEMNFVNNYSIEVEIEKFLNFKKKRFFSLSLELISCYKHIINVFFIWFKTDNNDQKFVIFLSKITFVISIDFRLQQIKIVFIKFLIIHWNVICITRLSWKHQIIFNHVFINFFQLHENQRCWFDN